MRKLWWVIVSVIFLALAGCNNGPKPTAVSGTLPPPLDTTPTAVSPTDTPRPTFTPELIFELERETAEPVTNTPFPTATPRPTNTPQYFPLSAADLQATIIARSRGNYTTFFVQEDLAFISLGNKLIILDTSNPNKPELISETILQTWIKRIQVVDGTLYAFLKAPIWEDEDMGGLQIIDIGDLANPVDQAYYDPGFLATDAIVIDDIAHIIGPQYRWDAVDVSNPKAPVKIGAVFESENWDCHGGGTTFFRLEEAGGFLNLYSGSCRNGGRHATVYDISNPLNPEPSQIVGTLYLGDMLDVAYGGNYVYILASYAGPFLRSIDVSNPEEPGIVGDLIIPIERNTQRTGSLILIDHFIYLATHEGLFIVDAIDPFNLTLVKTFYSEVYFTEIVAVNGLVYLLDWDNGLVILDTADPANPVEIAKWQR